MARESKAPSGLPTGEAFQHFQLNTGPTHEFGDLPEAEATLRNIGWTLGNDCPYRCTHCYSMNARLKGRDLTREMVTRIVGQLALNRIETVNLGGNEPLFTNGIDPRNTLLPFIIESLVEAGITVGLTTSGVTLLYLYKHHRHAFDLLNDVDVSFDSPYEAEHNRNRGAKIFHQAVESLALCQREGKPHSVILCAMRWNFDLERIDALLALASQYGANIRINPIKPTLREHMEVALPAELYYAGFARLMERCDPLDLGEPPIAAVTRFAGARRCPCGRTSFRIHSITPDGEIHVSPCVYLHDYKAPLDLLRHDLAEIIASPQFKVFRQRNQNPDQVEGCSGCSLLSSCGGGCAGRSFLNAKHTSNLVTFKSKDPYCPRDQAPTQKFPQEPTLVTGQRLVHMDYLCTWIGRPRPVK
jgi:radical SAM protein with 4Fe4S-binding SPASM domain